ncbi:MAG: NADH:ubiquinone reductase (Na(+)-transporting) subunit F, partial [Deltaproteobacteria bacterium]|nr:NADH:ubiquinone reductase (Na(+)-transporting) subunit F [Deltaproteobacteria bacterium]
MSGTARVHIDGIGPIEVPMGLNLREALRREGVFLDGTCADEGTCGRCV